VFKDNYKARSNTSPPNMEGMSKRGGSARKGQGREGGEEGRGVKGKERRGKGGGTRKWREACNHTELASVTATSCSISFLHYGGWQSPNVCCLFLYRCNTLSTIMYIELG
jgi:hypothetical protein